MERRVSITLSVSEARVSLRDGRVTPEQLVAATLATIDAEDRRLHAYLRLDRARATAQAEGAARELAAGIDRGHLHGVPLAVKDNFFIDGDVCTDGCPAYRDFVAPRTATVVQRLRDAGAVIVGAVHLHEGALAEHHPAFGPPPTSPFVDGMWPGGSSSGAGVAVAAGLCLAALGTDTGGSVRYPAALNGLTALKPTWGRLPTAGIHPLAPDLDTVGPLCRDARDLRAVFAVLDGRRFAEPLRRPTNLLGVRVGVDRQHLRAGVSPEVVNALDEVLDRMRSLGAEVAPVQMPSMTEPLEEQIALMSQQCASYHADRYSRAPEEFGQLADVIEDGLRRPTDTAARATATRRRFNAALRSVFQTVDAVLLPVLPVTGIRYDEYDEVMGGNPDIGRFTAPYNLGRQPAIVFPAGVADNGMPIGAQLIAPHGNDEALIDWVDAYQRAHPLGGGGRHG